MKKKRLLIYFCICLALFTLIGVSFFYLRKLNALEKYNERVDHSYKVIIQTNQLEKNLLNAETGQRGFLLTKDPDFLESYLGELKNIPGIFLELDYLTADNYRQQKNLDTLRDVINKQLGFLKSNLMTDLDDTLALSQFRQSNVYMNKIRDVIANIKKNEDNLLAERSFYKKLKTKDSREGSFLSLSIAFALVCIAAIVIIFFFNRNENYRADLEDKLLKLTTLNTEIKELTLASAHNLQEPMRKVQMIIDRVQHMAGVNDAALNEQLNRVKEIYNKQQVTNNTIIDYYTILSATEKKEKINLTAFIKSLQQKNQWDHEFALRLGPLKSIEADPTHLELLFKYIIDNSIRFRSPERDLEIYIHEAEQEENRAGLKNKKYYGLAVSDNGVGVEPEYLSKMFGLFQKMETSGATEQSGMGLSFCKRIMQNHNGSIAAKRNSPHGLTILLFFPK